MAGGGSRREDGALMISSSPSIFAALETLKKKKKKKPEKEPKGKASTNNRGSEESDPQQQHVFWAPTPLTVKCWADVDEDDDYYATTAPPQRVWVWTEPRQKKESAAAIDDEGSKTENDDLDVADDGEGEEEPEPKSPVATRFLTGISAPTSVSAKDADRQLSKKEMKRNEMKELNAVFAELGIAVTEDLKAVQHETSSNKEKQERADAPSESKRWKKKKGRKDKSAKETERVADKPADEPNVEDASVVDVSWKRIKKVASMKKNRFAKETDAAARAAAIEAATRGARVAAAKKKEQKQYNYQPVR